MNRFAFRFGAVISLLVVFSLFSGCVSVNLSSAPRERVMGTGPRNPVEFNVGTYTQVEIGANMEVTYSAQPSDTLLVEIHDNLREYLEITEQNGVLYIDSTKDFNSNNASLPKVYLTGPVLEKLKVRGGIIFDEGDTIAGESFTLDMGGAGDLELDLDVDNFAVSISGAGTAELSGRADHFSLGMAGAGTVEAFDLQTKTTAVDISGMGTVSISCSDSLEVVISGAGSVEYKGDPQVSKTIRGAGSVSRAG